MTYLEGSLNPEVGYIEHWNALPVAVPVLWNDILPQVELLGHTRTEQIRLAHSFNDIASTGEADLEYVGGSLAWMMKSDSGYVVSQPYDKLNTISISLRVSLDEPGVRAYLLARKKSEEPLDETQIASRIFENRVLEGRSQRFSGMIPFMSKKPTFTIKNVGHDRMGMLSRIFVSETSDDPRFVFFQNLGEHDMGRYLGNYEIWGLHKVHDPALFPELAQP